MYLTFHYKMVKEKSGKNEGIKSILSRSLSELERYPGLWLSRNKIQHLICSLYVVKEGSIKNLYLLVFVVT